MTQGDGKSLIDHMQRHVPKPVEEKVEAVEETLGEYSKRLRATIVPVLQWLETIEPEADDIEDVRANRRVRREENDVLEREGDDLRKINVKIRHQITDAEEELKATRDEVKAERERLARTREMNAALEARNARLQGKKVW
jgi:predicted transcriptional regulator